ncbi:uncharacterized protein LOC134779936 [Penaeus indicus]|uniref:uncharacterized protein LOC134779936 n=1 Tax=Penaeus indicus TaxID=29960 RepID=UPI00300CAB3B
MTHCLPEDIPHSSPHISLRIYKDRLPAVTQGKLTILTTRESPVCSAESGLASPLAASSLSALSALPFPSPGPACVHAARGGRCAPRQSSRNSWQSLQGPRPLPCVSLATAGSTVRKSHGQLKTCSTCTGNQPSCYKKHTEGLRKSGLLKKIMDHGSWIQVLGEKGKFDPCWPLWTTCENVPRSLHNAGPILSLRCNLSHYDVRRCESQEGRSQEPLEL